VPPDANAIPGGVGVPKALDLTKKGVPLRSIKPAITIQYNFVANLTDLRVPWSVALPLTQQRLVNRMLYNTEKQRTGWLGNKTEPCMLSVSRAA
jgi:hypothetical protein